MITPDVERFLADLSPDDWDLLVTRVRPPDHSEAFREVASRWISGSRLDAVVACGHHAQFLGEDGQMDAEKIERQLRALFGDDIPRTPAHQNFGQHAESIPQPGPGERGQAEAQARFESGYVTNGRPTHPEVERRFGKPEEN